VQLAPVFANVPRAAGSSVPAEGWGTKDGSETSGAYGYNEEPMRTRRDGERACRQTGSVEKVE
jgi:hypothetical protein